MVRQRPWRGASQRRPERFPLDPRGAPRAGASAGAQRRHMKMRAAPEAWNGPPSRPRPPGRRAPRPAARGGPETASAAAKTRVTRGGDFSPRRRTAFHRDPGPWRLWAGRRRNRDLNFFATAAHASPGARRAERSAPTAPRAAPPRQETARLPRRHGAPAGGPLRGLARRSGHRKLRCH